jgi:hypothetical protein
MALLNDEFDLHQKFDKETIFPQELDYTWTQWL